jgi:hypothetical protein
MAAYRTLTERQCKAPGPPIITSLLAFDEQRNLHALFRGGRITRDAETFGKWFGANLKKVRRGVLSAPTWRSQVFDRSPPMSYD